MITCLSKNRQDVYVNMLAKGANLPITDYHENLPTTPVVIRSLAKADILKYRKENNLPPFVRLIAIIISSNRHDLSIKGAKEIKVQLKKIDSIDVMGPVDSPLLKIKKNFRSRLLLRFKSGVLVQKKITKLLNSLKISSKIKLTVDVDPVNFG